MGEGGVGGSDSLSQGKKKGDTMETVSTKMMKKMKPSKSRGKGVITPFCIPRPVWQTCLPLTCMANRNLQIVWLIMLAILHADENPQCIKDKRLQIRLRKLSVGTANRPLCKCLQGVTVSTFFNCAYEGYILMQNLCQSLKSSASAEHKESSKYILKQI